ncbi:MAG: DUF2461 domain-containing protein [Atribacterota bacterium]|nr:DUF2461 domain-containing protein [Atribacterota bacterium]
MASKESKFEGFSAEAVFFLKNLKENNNREWFLARKKDYNRKVLKPAGDFVVEMGEMLQKISPGINADPKVNRSISRIYRDTRYASEEEPYRAYLGIWFWHGVRKAKVSPGYYFELSPDELYLSAGIKTFSRKIINSYRTAVANPESGEELLSIIEKIKENPDYQVSKEYYKKVPEGYKIKDSRKDLLRFNSLLVSTKIPIPPELYNRNLLKFVFKIFKDFSPIHNWLTEYVRLNGKEKNNI